MAWNKLPSKSLPILEHCPVIFSDSSEDEDQAITDGCAPEFAQARQIERRVQKLMKDLKSRHPIVLKEHQQLVELKSIVRQVFSTVYMCKTELDDAKKDNDWDAVENVKNILAVCQQAIKSFSGGELWDLQGMDEDE